MDKQLYAWVTGSRQASKAAPSREALKQKIVAMAEQSKVDAVGALAEAIALLVDRRDVEQVTNWISTKLEVSA